MSAIHIKPLREKIIETKSFKGLTKMMRIMTRKRNNLVIIEHGVTVANNIGYDSWVKQSDFSWANKNIVKELSTT